MITGTTTALATWQINIDVSTADPNADTGIASNKLYIGMDPAATDGYDNKFDTIALLGSPKQAPIHAYLFHSEYPVEQQKLWRDFRGDSLPQEWELEIESGAISNPINIIWEINAPNHYNFILIDKDTGQEIDITQSTEHSYTNNATLSKKFLLKIAEETPSTSPTPTTDVKGSGGGSKGGGCGYVKSVWEKGDNQKRSGHIAYSSIIFLVPLLLPFQQYVRRLVTAKQVQRS